MDVCGEKMLTTYLLDDVAACLLGAAFGEVDFLPVNGTGRLNDRGE